MVELLEDLLHGGGNGLGINEVAVKIDWRRKTGRLNSSDEHLGGGILNIEERYASVLKGESLDDRFADAARTAGDKDYAVAETGINGEVVGLFHDAQSLVN